MSEDDDEEIVEVEEGEGGEAGEEEGPTLEDGDSVEVEGSSSTYTLTRHGNVYMCTCPAWKNQSLGVDLRTCKHLRSYFGDEREAKRCGATSASRAASVVRASSGGRAVKKETAPPVLLAHKWEVDHDPTGWWMSEKLDGLRAYWDGETFVSRNGNVFYAPDWFTADLPADTLDGELWVDRKMFNKATSIVRSGAANAEWKKVSYVVFDAPNAKGGFEDRIAHAKTVLERAGAPHARALDHEQCSGFDHLREELRRVEQLGGEGLMLRKPGSKYEKGRSMTLLKVKTFHDTEARVIGHAPGTGKHKGRLGALVCELPTGIQFNVGTGFSDAEREKPPRIGAVITFRYQELTEDGVPRFPSWVGERVDIDLPAASKKVAVGSTPGTKAKAKPAPPPDDDVEEEAEEEDEAPPPKAKAKAKAPPPPDDEEEEEGEEEEADDETEDGASAGSIEGKKVMFTGKLSSMTRDQAKSYVEDAGGIAAGSVSKDLDFLVIGDDGSHLYGAGSKGEKTLKAEKLIAQGHDIKIISEKAFLAMVQGGGAEEEDVEEEQEAPPPPKKAKAKAPPPPDDDEEEEAEEEAEDEEEAPPPPKKKAAAAPAPKAKAPPPPDDDDEGEAEEEAEEEASDDEDDNPTYTARYGAVVWRQSLVNDDEDKFWKIEVRGTHHFATFGKNGTTGQVRLTNLGVASAARTDAEKRAMAKRKEGYRIVK